MMEKLSLKESVRVFVEERNAYYKQWVFDKPVIISAPHHAELARLQKLMYRMIVHFVTHYDQLSHLMPVEPEVKKVMSLCNQRPYKVGTYRTDFVYDAEQGVRIIEITSRFALNGMFLSAVMDELATRHLKCFLPELKVQRPYEAIYDHFSTYLAGIETVCILKGSDQRNESKIYADIFKRMGLQLYDIPFDQVAEHKALLSQAWIISELSFDEILAIPEESMHWLSQLNVINDFRTIFITHDKRFFEVLCTEELQAAVLNQEEQVFFRKFLVPTFSGKDADAPWEEARANKNQWIIKHRALGKSQSVYAGPVTEEDDWEALFHSDEKDDLVLQRWIDQKTVKGQIGQEHFDDFITGTLLFFDDHYFGPGDFRTSSFPVTNVKDHRKASSLTLSADHAVYDLSEYILIPART